MSWTHHVPETPPNSTPNDVLGYFLMSLESKITRSKGLLVDGMNPKHFALSMRYEIVEKCLPA